MAGRRDGTAGPLVRRQLEVVIADGHHRIECSEAEHATDWWRGRDDQESVVAPGAEAGNGAHGKATQSVGDEPLPGACGAEVARRLAAEADACHARKVPVEPET